MREDDILTSSPSIVLREEYDDWAILFNLDNCETFGINPTGVLIFKLLDGTRSFREIVEELQKQYEGVPDDVDPIILAFLRELMSHGMANVRCGEEQASQ